jgi:hypothetical protein
MPVGEVKVVRPGRTFKEVFVAPSGFSQGLEEVLVVIEGVHQIDITAQPENLSYQILPPPPKTDEERAREPRAVAGSQLTDADRIRSEVRQSMEAQGVMLGRGGRIPNFNAPAQGARPPAAVGAVPPNSGGTASNPAAGGESNTASTSATSAAPARSPDVQTERPGAGNGSAAPVPATPNANSQVPPAAAAKPPVASPGNPPPQQ